MISAEDLSDLNQKSLAYRKHILKMAHEHKGGVHIGGSLSLAEILTALYFHAARVDPKNPDWPDRDRIILSKGHANLGLLTILAMKGFFPFTSFDTFNQLGSHFSMHCDSSVPGVEHSAGSLGHGLSVAIGMALAAKSEKKPWRVFCILGDGESMEGSVWEAMMSASHYKLDNLTAVLDRNRLCQEGTTSDTMELEPLHDKIRAFGWSVHEVDGHNLSEILGAFSAEQTGQPKMIIANTIKGSGVPSLANTISSHFGTLNDDQYEEAIQLISQEES